jgi:hypothetical protein
MDLFGGITGEEAMRNAAANLPAIRQATVDGRSTVSGVDELVAFVRRCLDEDERVARAASVGPWRASPSIRSVYGPGSAVVNMPGPLPDWATYVVPPDSEGSEGIEPANAEHIARWDPARVLAEVEAKRQVLEAMEDQAREHLNTICNDPEAEGRYVQRAEFYRQEVARLLAQPYAGQPGWREEWRT